MKNRIRTALLFFTAISALAQQEPGSHRFSTYPELVKWAQEGSFGGGRIDVLSHKGFEIAIVNHAYTSGVQSSGVIVFVKRKTGWDEALRLGPYWLDSVGFKQQGDTVALQPEHGSQEILRFSIAALHHQFEDPRQSP